VRAVDVAVDHADARAAPGERDREVDRDGGLADAALACANRDDILDARKLSAARIRIGGGADARGHLNLDRLHARQRHHRRTRLIAQMVLHRTGRRRQLDAERHAAVGEAQVLDEPERDDVLVEIGILDDLERVEDRGFTEGSWRPRHTPPVYYLLLV